MATHAPKKSCSCPVCTGDIDDVVGFMQAPADAMNALYSVKSAQANTDMVKSLVLLRAHVENGEFSKKKERITAMLVCVNNALHALRVLEEATSPAAVMETLPLFDKLQFTSKSNVFPIEAVVALASAGAFGRALLMKRNTAPEVPKGTAPPASTAAAAATEPATTEDPEGMKEVD